MYAIRSYYVLEQAVKLCADLRALDLEFTAQIPEEVSQRAERAQKPAEKPAHDRGDEQHADG